MAYYNVKELQSRYPVKEYLLNQGFKIKPNDTIVGKCPFCGHSNHLKVFRNYLYSFSGCLGRSIDIFEIISRLENVTKNEAIKIVAERTNARYINNTHQIKQKIEVKYDFKDFYNYLVSEFKKYKELKIIPNKLKTKNEMILHSLMYNFFDELTNLVINAKSDSELEQVDTIKKNFKNIYNEIGKSYNQQIKFL